MKGDIRCVEGRSFRHDPQHDDPDLETDVGQCPECEGKGCEIEKDDEPQDLLDFSSDVVKQLDSLHKSYLSLSLAKTEEEMQDALWCIAVDANEVGNCIAAAYRERTNEKIIFPPSSPPTKASPAGLDLLAELGL